MFLERFEDIFDLLEDDDERILARNGVLCRLYESDIRSLRERSGTIGTKSKTPALAKMTFAGENTWKYEIRH